MSGLKAFRFHRLREQMTRGSLNYQQWKRRFITRFTMPFLCHSSIFARSEHRKGGPFRSHYSRIFESFIMYKVYFAFSEHTYFWIRNEVGKEWLLLACDLEKIYPGGRNYVTFSLHFHLTSTFSKFTLIVFSLHRCDNEKTAKKEDNRREFRTSGSGSEVKVKWISYIIDPQYIFFS